MNFDRFSLLLAYTRYVEENDFCTFIYRNPLERVPLLEIIYLSMVDTYFFAIALKHNQYTQWQESMAVIMNLFN